MDVRKTVRRTFQGPVRDGWKRHKHRLPAGTAETVRRRSLVALDAAGVPIDRNGGLRSWRGPLDVTTSWPGIAEERDDALRGKVFEHLLGPGDGRTLLDLGAGPCQFARRARRLGWKVTAVDGRTERLPDDLDGITFIEADVRGFDTHGYDTIAILGLLYHLTLAEQEALLRSCVGTRVILETQVHTPGYVPPAAEPWGRRIRKVDGLKGVVFPEGDNPMASIGNPTSLWLTEDSLLRLVQRVGFARVELVEPAHHSKYGTRRFLVLDGRR